jgi:hypothetical protein
VSSNSFPATSSDVTTNLTLSVSVPAGQHTLKLWNPGQDWVLLGNITLNPYASMLGAYQIGNAYFAALWLWHRTNIYNPNATATVSATFELNGLAPGDYAATWWDTFAGAALSNFTFAVSGTNGLTISTPAILRSAAMFATLTPISAWRLAHFGTAANSGIAADNADPDHDGLVNIIEYAFNLDPLVPSPYPLSWSLDNRHLTVTFRRTHPPPPDISYLVEVSNDPSATTWNSGPAYTSQSVTDNLDGTETVVETDLAASPSPAAHYLRVRISAP